AIGISVGENLLVGKLVSEVPKYTSAISPQAVIQAGALNLDKLTSSPTILMRLREVYSVAVSATMICATVAICVSIPAIFGMRYLNLVKVSKERTLAQKSEMNAVSVTESGTKQLEGSG
ncbi:hypothetical protein MMC25_002594, partial [Agyrium rufum]|nr:hypothetical protein [Agyrium rufum]